MGAKTIILSLVLTQVAFAAETSANKETCTAYRISDATDNNPQINCIVPVGEASKNGFQPVKVFLGGLIASGSMNAYKPSHYWNLEAEFPFEAKAGLSFAFQNIQISNVKGLRISVFHASDNGYELVQNFDIPGYLITDISTKAVAVSAGRKSTMHVGKFKTGLEKILTGQEDVKEGGTFIWDIESENSDVTVDISTGEYEASVYSNEDAVGDLSKEIYVGGNFVQLYLKDAGKLPVNAFKAKTVGYKPAASNRAATADKIVFGLEFLSPSK